MAANEDFVLWGFKESYKGPDGSVAPLRLTRGTMRHCKAEQKFRTREGGWTLGIYAQGDAPAGLRAQCAAVVR